MTRPEEVILVEEHVAPYLDSFTDLEGGRILRLTSTGGEETTFRTSDDSGKTWSDPFQGRTTAGDVMQGGRQVQMAGNTVGMVTSHRVENPNDYPYGPEKIESRIVYWRSDDGGRTWNGPFDVSAPGLTIGGWYLITLASGHLVLVRHIGLGMSTGPMSALGDLGGVGKLLNGQWTRTSGHTYDPMFSCCVVYYSDDKGETWRRNSDGELIIGLDPNTTFSFVNEPTATEVEPGKILMLMRTGLGRQFQAWSYDDGETWTRPAPTSLASSPAPAQVRTLPNGHLLVVWTQQGGEEIRRGYLRTRLSAAISRNGGSAWEFFQNIESLHEETRVEPGPIQRYAPEEYHLEPGQAAPERDPAYVTAAGEHNVFDYPGVSVYRDRVFVTYNCRYFEEHPTEARLVVRHVVKLKVLPITWFYGGKEPVDSPFLPRAGYRPTWG